MKELIPAGNERLVVVARMTGTARGGGVPIDEGTFGVYEFRHGRAFRAEWFATRGEALEAARPAE